MPQSHGRLRIPALIACGSTFSARAADADCKLNAPAVRRVWVKGRPER